MQSNPAPADCNRQARKSLGPAPWERAMRRGKAGEVIEPFRVEPGEKFIVLCRVSSHQQGRRGNLLGHATVLPREVERRGGTVLKVLEYEWSGQGPGWDEILNEAGLLCLEHGAILLAATPDRFIRACW